MKILLRNYDIAIKECVVPLTHEILHNEQFLRLYTYINIKYSFKLAFAKDPIGNTLKVFHRMK
jgi:hypothetical protein